MSVGAFFFVIASSYLLGSLNSAIIVSRTVLHQDIRSYGSGNAGLTNSYRTMGGSLTLLVLGGDILKAIVAISIGGMLGGPFGKLISGAFVILGHVYPVYFQFKGGKGVLVGAVMLALFDIRIFGIAFVCFALALLLTRWVSLGSILGAISVPITAQLFYHDLKITVLILILAGAVVYMHRGNIKRILNGTENKFVLRPKKQILSEQTNDKQSDQDSQ